MWPEAFGNVCCDNFHASVDLLGACDTKMSPEEWLACPTGRTEEVGAFLVQFAIAFYSLFGGVDRFVAVERGQNFCPIQFLGTLAPPRCLQKCWYCF